MILLDGEAKGKEERNPMFNYLNNTPEHVSGNRTGNHRSSGSGSAGSGGDSDETCASNRATRNSATPSPLHTDDSPGNDNDHNSSYSGGSSHSHSSTSSQLRQMLLTNGGSESSHSSSGTKSCSSSSCGSQAGAVHHNGNNQDQDSMNAMYSLKFKTNIQQRFTAHNMDHEFPSMSTASAMMTPTSMNSASNSDQQQQQEQQQHSYEKGKEKLKMQSKSIIQCIEFLGVKQFTVSRGRRFHKWMNQISTGTTVTATVVKSLFLHHLHLCREQVLQTGIQMLALKAALARKWTLHQSIRKIRTNRRL